MADPEVLGVAEPLLLLGPSLEAHLSGVQVACQVVLRELMQLLETQLLSGTVTELFHAYAGKAPVPASFAQYLKSKPQMRV